MVMIKMMMILVMALMAMVTTKIMTTEYNLEPPDNFGEAYCVFFHLKFSFLSREQVCFK